MSSRFPVSILDGLRKVSGDGRGGGPSFFAMAFSDERVTVGRIQGGTEAGPESRAGEGQAGPGGVWPRCGRGGCCGHPGRGWGADGGGQVRDRDLQIYNTSVKFFLITHLIVDFGILANPWNLGHQSYGT